MPSRSHVRSRLVVLSHSGDCLLHEPSQGGSTARSSRRGCSSRRRFGGRASVPSPQFEPSASWGEWRIDVPRGPLLGVLGLFVAASAIWSPSLGIGSVQLCSTPRLVIEGSCWAAAELIEPSWFLVAGSATGIIAARRGVGREVLPAALALALPSAVITFYQGATASAGLIVPGIVSVAGGVIVSIAVVLAYTIVRAGEARRPA